jgi:hypothetical protein
MKTENNITEQPNILAVNDEQLSALRKATKFDTEKLSRVLLVNDNEAVRSSLERFSSPRTTTSVTESHRYWNDLNALL